jgi:hypothetical protein
MDISILEMGRGVGIGLGGVGRERVKGGFFASLHTGVLIASGLMLGDGSECTFVRSSGYTPYQLILSKRSGRCSTPCEPG